ncbi:MAG TPA: tetratricopeptide repeat protein [Candidatus Obscuribacterales bacterium]
MSSSAKALGPFTGANAEAKELLKNGRVLFSRGDYEQAAQAFSKAAALCPSAEARFEFARALARKGEDDRALAEFLESLSLDRNQPQARIEMAAILMKRLNYDEAGGQLRQALELRPDDLATRGNYAICLQNLGFFDLAIEQFKIILSKDPTSVEALYNLGVALRLKGKVDEAQDLFKKVILHEPKPTDVQLSLAHTELGKCLLLKKDVKSAVALERLAIKYMPSNHWAFLTLGEALNQQGKTDEALDAFRQAIQLKPKSPECRKALSELLNKKLAQNKENILSR